MVLEFVDCFVGKTLSAPCNSVLCELLHPSAISRLRALAECVFVP